MYVYVILTEIEETRDDLSDSGEECEGERLDDARPGVVVGH